MSRAAGLILAAGAALILANPLAAQEREPITFAGDVFDVTGAGELDLGDIDPILLPYLTIFRTRPIMAKLELDVTVDAAGAVSDCRATVSDGLAEAGAALCVHARAVGRFRAKPWLTLDYTQANYRSRIALRFEQAEGETLFYPATSSYPDLEDRPVIFGDGAIPAENKRLSKSDVTIAPMDYPRHAARNEVMGRVAVALMFDAEGKAVSCRPIRSSFTARLAYETCDAAMGAVRLQQAPDARPYVLSVFWSLN